MDLSLGGRWRIEDCANRYFGACRDDNQPFIWKLSASRGAYSSHDGSCPDSTKYAVPRTGIENMHLLNTLRNDSDSLSDGVIWLNFNSLNQAGCWVVGTSTICPYNNTSTSRNGRNLQIVIPVVLAVIILVLFGLLLFVKCAANRRTYKRGKKRRVAGDVDAYEGVPA